MSSNKTPRGLGKGLEALLGGTSISESGEIGRRPVEYVKKLPSTGVASDHPATILLVDVNLIDPNPFQPRLEFDEEALAELSESIKALGLIQPITIRRMPSASSRYQIISGERRFRACKAAGMKEIPAYIVEASSDQKMLEMAIVENIQREDLDPIEIALSYRRLIDECDLTQEAMAVRIGKKRASIANYLRLLKLPAKVQHDLKTGALSVGHAKVLLSVDDPYVQERLCDETLSGGWSVRDLEDKINALTRTTPNKSRRGTRRCPSTEDMSEAHSQMLALLGRHCDGEISLKRYAGGSSTVTIHFNNDEEVAHLLLVLKTANL